MSTNIYSIDQKLSEIFQITPTNLITDSEFNEINYDELFYSHWPAWNKGMNDSGMKDKKHSEETRKKISDSHKLIDKIWLRRPMSESTKQKIRESKLGKKRPEMSKEKIALKGNNRTEAQKHQAKKHSERMKGKIAPNRKKIVFRGIEFDAVTHAMKYFNLSATTFYNELRSN